MTYNVGVNDQVNGGVHAGDFLTGKMDFFTIATVIPVAQTNVTTPVSYLYTQQGYSTWQPVTVTASVNGVPTAITYSTQSDYLDALKKQQNLDLLIRTFAQRANPVALSVTAVASVSNPAAMSLSGYSYSGNMGSAYSGTYTVNYVRFATEKSGTEYMTSGATIGGLWLVSGSTAGADTNAIGYQLLDALQGVTVQDLASPILANGYTTIETLDSTNRNTIAAKGLFL